MSTEQSLNQKQDRPVKTIRMWPDQWEQLQEVMSDKHIKRKYRYVGDFLADAVEHWYKEECKEKSRRRIK